MLELIRILMSFTGAFAFSLLFNIKGKRLLFASLGGLLCGIVYYISSLFSAREVLAYFSSSIAVTIYAEIVARILKSPATSFLGPGVIPLVPGGNLYFTMAAALHGDLAAFFEQGMEAVYIALSIAAGILVISPAKKLLTELIAVSKESMRKGGRG